MAGKRNLLILGTAPNEYLVHAEDDEEQVRAALKKMLPSASFELTEVTPKQAERMRSRLSDSQHGLMNNLSKGVNSKVKKNAAAYKLAINSDQRLGAVASATGIIKFSPEISKISKPLGGGIGPVGVTVGVGIAGKF